MQALIDFDGWRKWKDFATHDKAAIAAAKSSITTPPNGLESTVSSDRLIAGKEKKAKREKKMSLEADGTPAVAAAR